MLTLPKRNKPFIAKSKEFKNEYAYVIDKFKRGICHYNGSLTSVRHGQTMYLYLIGYDGINRHIATMYGDKSITKHNTQIAKCFNNQRKQEWFKLFINL